MNLVLCSSVGRQRYTAAKSLARYEWRSPSLPPHFRVGGVLIPTRSFGDFLLKSEMDKPAWKQVISVVPQIVSHRLDSTWDFVVVASDGVWDAITNRDLVAFVRERLHGDSGEGAEGGGGGGKKKVQTRMISSSAPSLKRGTIQFGESTTSYSPFPFPSLLTPFLPEVVVHRAKPAMHQESAIKHALEVLNPARVIFW